MKKKKRNKIINQVKRDRAARREAAKGQPVYNPSVVHKTSKKDIADEVNNDLSAEEVFEAIDVFREDPKKSLLDYWSDEYYAEEEEEDEKLYEEIY